MSNVAEIPRTHKKTTYIGLIYTGQNSFTGENSGIYEWKIPGCNQDMIKQLQYLSDGAIFKMCHLKWKIYIVTKNRSPQIALMLLLPCAMDQICVSFSLSCPQRLTCTTQIAVFDIKNASSTPAEYLSLPDWKDLQGISLIVSIHINYIALKKTVQYLPISCLSVSVQYHVYRVTYGHNLGCKFHTEIDAKMLKKMKQSVNATCFESLIFKNMWRLRIYPNCFPSDDTVSNKGYCAVFLQLCSVPSFVQKICISYTIECNNIARETQLMELNVDEINEKSFVFGYKKFMTFKNLKQLKSMEFGCTIEVWSVKMREEHDIHHIYDSKQISNTLVHLNTSRWKINVAMMKSMVVNSVKSMDRLGVLVMVALIAICAFVWDIR
eukprot:428632_1